MKIFTRTIFFALSLLLTAGLAPAHLWAEPVPAIVSAITVTT